MFSLQAISQTDYLSYTALDDGHASFLTLVYVTRSPTSWISRIGLHLFDVDLESSVALSSLTIYMRLDIGIATATQVAVTVAQSLPAPKIIVHYIQHHDVECAMAVKVLTLAEGLQSRNMFYFERSARTAFLIKQ